MLEQEREQFIVEIQMAIRTLSHGLTMGNTEMRHNEQKSIIEHPGKLREEIASAVKRANGFDRKGPDESAFESEYRV
jgi:hypothetical protein